MNQLMLYPTDESAEGEFEFVIQSDARFLHLKKILNSKVGDQLRVALLGVGRGEAQIIDQDDHHFRLKIISSWEKTSPILPDIHLMVGMTRPPSMKKIMEYASGMGVKSYHWIQTDLSDKSYWNSKILRPEVYEPLMDLGLSQSNFYYERPSFHTYQSKKRSDWPFNENKNEEGSVHKFILSPESDKSWNDYLLTEKSAGSRPIVLAIGPERGFTKDEENFLIQNNHFLPVNISQTLLRVELAVFYALAQIEMTLCLKNKLRTV